MYLAEKKGKTENGNFYCILQDTRTSFQISVTVGTITQHELVNNPSSLEELDEVVIELEKQLMQDRLEGD